MAKSKGNKGKNTTRSKKGSVSGITHIKVVGVGGGGGNIVGRMREKNRIKGVEYIAVNTDAQDLNHTSAHKKIYIGKALTRGLGAGMNPEIGKQAAEENRSEIGEMLDGADIVFITAGFGGGTGTGAAPIIADIAREKGILTVAIVTKPFAFEGSRRMSIATDGLARLKDTVDAMIVVPNDRVFSIISKDTPLLKAFSYIDDILNNSVRAVADLINTPGIINVDFADIKTILREAGPSLVGVGVAAGQDRGEKAVDFALNSPLLEASIDGAKGVLFSISGGSDLKMAEVNDIAKAVVSNLDSGARVIFGAYYDRSLKNKSIKVTVIATGFNGILGETSPVGIPKLFSSEERIVSPAPRGVSGPADKDEDEKNDDKDDKKKNGKQKSRFEPLDIPAFLRKKKR